MFVDGPFVPDVAGSIARDSKPLVDMATQVISHTLLPGDVVGASNTHAPAASTAVTGARPAAVAPAPSSGHLLDM